MTKVEVAPFDAREAVVTLVTVGVVCWFFAALSLVQGGGLFAWTPGPTLFVVGAVCMVGGLVVHAVRGKTSR